MRREKISGLNERRSMLPLILLKVLFWLDEFALSDGGLVAVLRLLLDCWVLGM